MPDLWLVLGLQVIALVGGFLAGAIALAIGGFGVTRNLAKRLDYVEDFGQRVDDKLTREVKRRVGAKGVQARQTETELRDEAQQRITDGSPRPAADLRPSIVGR